MESSLKRPQRYRCGIAAFLKGDYQEAVDALAPLIDGQDIISKTAKTYLGLAHARLGLASLEGNDFGPAESHLLLALRLGAGSDELHERLADSYWRQGRLDNCCCQMENAVESRKENVRHWRKLAQAQWFAGKRQAAYMTVQKAMRQVGPDAELYMQSGLFKSAEGNHAEARKDFALATDADCCCAQAHVYLGLAAAAASDLPGAIEAFQRALELRPDDIMTAYRLCLALKAARQAGVQIVVRLPDMASARLAAVRVLWQYVAMESDFVQAAMCQNADNSDNRKLLELVLWAVHSALDAYPRYADLHMHAARILERLGQYKHAIEHAAKAVSLNPSYAAAYALLGQLHAMVGERQRAIECLNQAFQAGGDWPDVHCLAGELLIEAKATHEARNHLQRAMELKTDYKRAAAAMKRLAA